jgi:hypothetical protein
VSLLVAMKFWVLARSLPEPLTLPAVFYSEGVGSPATRFSFNGSTKWLPSPGSLS